MCLNGLEGIEKQPPTYEMLLKHIERTTQTAKEAILKINKLESDNKILQELVESFNKTNIKLVKEINTLNQENEDLQNDRWRLRELEN